MNTRQLTALALICVEWDGVLTHLRALRQVGCCVSDQIWEEVVDEARTYTVLWTAVNREWWTYEQAIAGAQAWLAWHREDREDLLR